MAERGTGREVNKYARKDRYLLVVDSDANNLFYLSMLLQRLEYRIFTAVTAEEAIAMSTVAVPSLILTALDLNGMSGLEFMQKLKQNADTADVPFIGLLSQGDLLGERRCSEAGAVECLLRPISAEMLFQAVQAAIETTPRRYIRIRVKLPVTVTNMPIDGIEDVYTSVLSECGMFLRTTKPASVDTQLSIQIDLNGRNILIEAIVLSSHWTGGGPYHEPGMGLKFVRLAPKDAGLIRQFIRDEVTRGITPEKD